ncbi:MAG: hypothetical protein CHACPFDD_03097 [Phycisphaerae bacterium]|nr:hypothetical protein [Phycisphaerae bacterium]
MGGRVADVAIAPHDANTFYVGFATGGLWKTTNNGTTFSPVFDDQATSSIGAVAVADAPPDWIGWEAEPPSDAPPTAAGEAESLEERGRAKIVWVGTGEGNGRNSSSWGAGVYRSTDAGESFQCVGLADSHDIPRIAVHPKNPDVCLVAALGHLWGPNKERGVYKTSDGGKTWRAVLQIDENTGACDVVIDPQNPDNVFAAMYMRRRSPWSYQSGGPQGGIYRSRDGGETWTKLASGLPAQTGRIGLDIFAADPRIVMAVIESDLGGWGIDPFDDRSKAGGVFRSEDGGETWARVFDRSPRAFYFSRIRIDPQDAQRVYLLGWGLCVSDDGGRTFRAGGARKPHGDLHAMAIDRDDPDRIVLGTDGGVYISYDRSETWDFLNHLAAGQFYNIAFDMLDPYRVGGGLQDNGSWIGPSATLRHVSSEDEDEPAGGITPHDWIFVNWGDGFHVAFDPQDRNIVYAESQGGDLMRVHLDTSRRKLLKPAPKEGQPRFRFNWNSPFFISPHNPTTLYFGGNYVFKLTERGERWERISEDLSTRVLEKVSSVGSEAETHGTAVSLAESPLAAGLLWAGTDDGLVHVTADDGKTWANVTPPDGAGRYVTKIEPSHHVRERAYVSVDGHRNDDMAPAVFVTDDLGRSWRSIAGDLPDGAPVKVVREDRKNPSVLYVGTERAAYVSIDGGAHWIKLNGKSLPTVAVDDLGQQPREMDLIAGTHGRSIYILDDASPISQLSPEVLNKDLHAFETLPARPRHFIEAEGFWSDRRFIAANPPMGAKIHYWLREYTGEDVQISIDDEKGRTVRELDGSQQPGINRVVWDLQPEKYDQLGDPPNDASGPKFVPAGTYHVTITCGKQKSRTTVTVLPAAGEAVR